MRPTMLSLIWDDNFLVNMEKIIRIVKKIMIYDNIVEFYGELITKECIEFLLWKFIFNYYSW